MNQSPNSFTLDLSSNLQNLSLQEVLTKILNLSKENPSNTAIIRVGSELISLNITKVQTQSQEQISMIPQEKTNNVNLTNESSNNLINTDSRKIETLENSDSLVRHMSDREDTKQFISPINNFVNTNTHLSKLLSFPLPQQPKPGLLFGRHYSADPFIPNKPCILTRSFSEKALKEEELTLFKAPLLMDNAQTRRYSNEIDFNLSMSKESLSMRKLESRLTMSKGESAMTFKQEAGLPYQKETSLNIFSGEKTSFDGQKTLEENMVTNQNGLMPYGKEISLKIEKDNNPLAIHHKVSSANFGGAASNLLNSLSMSKGLSSLMKYKQSSEELELNMGNRGKNLMPAEHESFNTLDFNVSKSDSKSGSPIKKPMLGNFITIENQAEFDEQRLQPMHFKSEDNSAGFMQDLDIEKLEISKSLYILESSQGIGKKTEDNGNQEEKYASPLGMSKKSENNNTNLRYLPQKNNMIESKSFSNFSESVETSLKKSGEEDYLTAVQTLEETIKKTDPNSKLYNDLKRTLAIMGSFNERIFAKEMMLSSKEMELKGMEKSLKEKERKINELLEKNSKSSMDNASTGNTTKDPLKELLEEQMSDSSRPKSFSIPSESKIHFLFLYASPLVTYFKDSEGKVGKRQIFNEINYAAELKQVQEILISSHKEIKFLSVPASLERLSLSLDKNPLALHFCGHGVRNNEETFGFTYDQTEGDFLILEDEAGGAYFLSSKNLENLLKKLKNKLYFVFVASCHSKIVGEVFLKAGALHVICVKREERILDIACQIFSKAFYHACLTGEQTICEAFSIAKRQVSLHEGMPPGEENKFVLLIKDDDDIYSEHTCFGWVDAGPGVFQDMNERPEFDQLPSSIENFMGRNEVMHDLIALVMNSRMVTIKGIAGIGKSSLLKEAVRYIAARKRFRNGIIYLNLNCCETKEAVISCLMARILRNNSRFVQSGKEYKGKMLYQIVEQLRTKEVLIVFDNVMEIMLVNEKENFHNFVDLLLSNCNDIKILSSSRTSLGDGNLPDYSEKIITLGPLSDEDSKNLLLARAPRIIPPEEIEDLLNMEIDGNFGLPLENKKEFVGHAFFELFGGHPQAITLASSLLDEKTLKEVFLYLKENSVINAFDYGADMSETDRKGFNSLKSSLNVSFESLMKKNKSAGRLLAFLGLFPGGIQEEDLAVFWEKSYKVDIEVLLKSSFLRKTVKDSIVHYSLFPFMAKFGEERLNYVEKREYHEQILRHFASKIEQFYKVIGTISKEAETQMNILIRYELNIRACIFREITYQGNDDLEKSLYDSFNLNTSAIRINERFKDIEAIREDDEDDLALTKNNIEMIQKLHKSSVKQNASFSGNSLRSSSPIYITENMANQLKTPKSKVADMFSVSQSGDMFKFNFNQSGAASASLENSNNTMEGNENINCRHSFTPEPESLKEQGRKELKLLVRTDVSINTDQMNSLEPSILGKHSHKKTPKFSKDESIPADHSKVVDLIANLRIDDDTTKPISSNPSPSNPKGVKILDITATFNGIQNPIPLKVSNDTDVRISQNSSISLNKSQDMFLNLKTGSKEHILKDPYRLRGGNLRKSLSGPQGQIQPINKLIIYYSSILFLLRRYGEAIKMLRYGLKIADNTDDLLAEANYYRIFGVVGHLKKQSGKALADFQRSKELFQRAGCALGVAICEAAMGYIKFSENGELLQAKEHLQHSLRIYENLDHSFGIHFLNRWLGSIKQKIPKSKSEIKAHFAKAEHIRNIKKEECVLSFHKAGFFVLRWMGDPISLFMETPLKAVEGNGTGFRKKEQGFNKPLLGISKKDQKMERKDTNSNNNMSRNAKNMDFDLQKMQANIFMRDQRIEMNPNKRDNIFEQNIILNGKEPFLEISAGFKKKPLADCSDSEIKSLSKTMHLNLETSYEIDNASAGFDDLSNNKTPANVCKPVFKNFIEEGEDTGNGSGNSNSRKPPNLPIPQRKSYPRNYNEGEKNKGN